jgi:putative nucleotidyltransferase with HDIG domain
LSYQTRELRHAIDARADVQCLKLLLERRGPATASHGIRVAEYAAELALRMNLSEQEMERVARAALLHDLGKIAIPNSILGKPSALTPHETRIMQSHADVGASILAMHSELSDLTLAVRHHHERFDGSGYPDRLAGDDIPFASRLIAVVDAFDAMTAGRPYQPAVSVADACSELTRCSASQFDPRIVDEFTCLLAEYTTSEAASCEERFLRCACR